jgi:hypothetical protein
MSNNHPWQPFGFNDARDGDVGPDSTPFGVRSPVARRAIDESFVAPYGKTHAKMIRYICNGDVGLDGTPFGVRSPIARQAINASYIPSNGATVHSIVDQKGSHVSTTDQAIRQQSTTSKDCNHHSTINYSMVDDGNINIPTSKFCHTFASKSGVASMRSRAASVAWLHNSSSQLLSRSAIKHRQRRKKKKEAKQSELLEIIGPNDNRTAHGKNFSTEYLQKNVVVFDGGVDIPTAPLSNPDVSGWSCHRIVDGVLDVCSPPSCYQGLMYQDKEMDPSFILLPRKEALKINSDARALCIAMANIARKKNNLVRGASKTVFGNSKYCCVGSRARRNAPGVEHGNFNLVGASTEDWDTIVSAVKRSEHAFFSYSGTDVIRHIKAARELSPWESIRPSNATDGNATQIFNGIAFGVNVYLRAHVDLDFTYSVIQVHTADCDYGFLDDVLCYFSFPRLGVTVPLKPGDFLLVNALEYHCLSTRCNADVDIFCVSSYLKTAIVGGNDNNRLLSDKEMESLNTFPAMRGDRKRDRDLTLK